MGEYKTQTRKLADPGYGNRYQWPDGAPDAFINPDYSSGPTNLSNADLRPTQTTYSYRSSTRIPDEFSPEAIREFTDVTRNGFTETNPEWDTGHSFHTTKTSSRASHLNFRHYAYSPYDGKKYWRKGPLVPTLDSTYGYVGKFPEVPRLSASEISKYGASAISKTSPTNANANLSQALLELTEGLPRVAGMQLLKGPDSISRSLGSEYLNGAFGWLPLISDVQSIARAVSHSTRLIKQYKRDSGKLVRRRYSFPREVENSVMENLQHPRYVFDGYDRWTDSQTWFDTSSGDQYPKVSMHNHTTKDVWFAGAFMYHLEADDSLLGKLTRFEELANHLLGTRITPSTLWELAPWSWFGDWFGTFGDFLQTTSLLSSDGLVMKYGYLMRHTVQHNTYSMPSGFTFKGGIKTGPVSYRLSRETKERVQATPYGFGLLPTNFSVRQWAILGALGLTKAPGILP